jgi:hypothetical protein
VVFGGGRLARENWASSSTRRVFILMKQAPLENLEKDEIAVEERRFAMVGPR